ncbi:hypothetical protein [Anabaena azotica]|uniref:Uncharacterized protein n=1 Tax=Anabaena azotica FACHB-119 TaxID=947527 RepID=A0ABR8DD39_9NOST|nr:hypothetical protein [Anabaena azotica]MBD2504886.1 hypothetical protein [Anabaena azotica FACHB-119]
MELLSLGAEWAIAVLHRSAIAPIIICIITLINSYYFAFSFVFYCLILLVTMG